MLLAVLTSGTLGRVFDLAGSLVKVLLVVAAGQDSSTHQELDSFEADMAKSIVPSEQLFLRLGEIDVGIVHSSDSRIQAFGSLRQVFFAMSL